VTATIPQYVDLRDCRLYRFWVIHPLTGETVLGYVGETVRQPFERLMEHVQDQPWIDTVVRWEIDDRVFTGKQAVLQAESAAIRAERPLYNVRGNESNPLRIPPPEAIRQRRARDLERRRPRWVHPADRALGAAATSRPVAQTEARPWKPWQKALLGYSCGWLAVSLAGWFALARNVTFTEWWHPAAVAGFLTLVVVLLLARWAYLGFPVTKGQRRRAKARLRRRR
jgi:hypothetical protein